jgi:glycosyltransferase involved in cell wall biosynthesis
MFDWHILTGEYPPQPGGVSDYTRLIGRGLAAAGDRVTVWCPPCAGADETDEGVRVRRLPDHFGRRSRAVLDRCLPRRTAGTRLLVQYVPHAYGWKAMNVPFCLWLRRQRRLPVWVMFHEVAFPLRWGQPPAHTLVGLVTHLMAWLVRRSAARCFVSAPAWAARLRRLAPGGAPIEWLPVPSTLPDEVSPEEAASVRARLGAGAQVVGHFGTFGGAIASLLQDALPPLLRSDARRVLLVGRHSEGFARQLGMSYPAFAGRVAATGGLPPHEAAAHLAACDVLLQPYPDGATARRTSLMAGLALGKAVVTTTGPLSEPLWAASDAVLHSPPGRPAELAQRVEDVLNDPALRDRLERRARALYRERFSLPSVIATLRA